MKTKILIAILIAFWFGSIVTYSFLWQSYDDLKATWWNTALTEELWNSLVNKVKNISSWTDWSVIVWPSDSWQWIITIYWPSDNWLTHSALYLAWDTPNNGDSWVIARKKSLVQRKKIDYYFDIGLDEQLLSGGWS